MKKPTKIEVKNDLIIVTANNTGNEFVFDYTEDLLKKLSGRTWSESRDGYLYSYDKKGKRIYAHHFILPKRKDLVTDHIDQNKKNNRSSNLRYATKSQNSFNGKVRKNNKSGIIGVSWCRKSKKWKATIRVNRKKIHLGFFEDLKDAAKARFSAEEKYFPGIKFKHNECKALWG